MMNQSNRYLPPLNLCYLQRKAYHLHLKKLETIKISLRNTSNLSGHDSKNQLRDTSSHSRYANPKQQPQLQIEQRLSPFRKRVIRAADEQNQRLFNHIRKCASTINRKEIIKASFYNEQIKNRIRKFKSVPSSKTPLLKSELSLDSIESRGRRRLTESNIRYSHRINELNLVQYNPRSRKDIQSIRVRSSNLGGREKAEAADRQRMKTESSGRYVTERFLLQRNVNKIRSHFNQQEQNNEFRLKAKAKVIALRKNAETYSRLLQRPAKHPGCFTSQLSHYQQIQKEMD